MTDHQARPILILLTDGFADWETSLIAGAGRNFAIKALAAAGKLAEFRRVIRAEHA